MPQIDFQAADTGAKNLTPSENISGIIDFQPVESDASIPAEKRVVEAPKQKKEKISGPTFSADHHSLLSNIKDAFVGPGTTYGAAESQRTGGPQENQFEKPLIDFQAITKGLNPPQQFGKAVLGGIQGAETFLSGLTTPRNAELFAAMGGISKAAPLVSRLVALGFSYSTLKQAFEQAPQFQEKVKAQDIQGAVKVLTEIGLSTALGTKLAMHGSAEIPGPTFEGKKAAPERAGRGAPESRTQDTSEPPPAAGSETAGAPRVDFQPTAGHETTVSKPTRDTSPVTLGFGLGALGEMDLSTPESEALKAQRKEALDALEKAKASPEQNNLAAKLRSLFTGTRDFIETWTNQKMLALRKSLPDHVDREALTLARDFKGREEELQQFLDGTHPWLSVNEIAKRLLEDKPDATRDDVKKAVLQVAAAMEKMKPVIERALNPSEAMTKADGPLTRIAEQFLKMGQSKGILDSSIGPEVYAPHMINPGEGLAGEGGFDPDNYRPINDRGKLVAGKIARKFGHAMARNYPTMLHAIADGLQPRTLDIIDAFTIYGDKFATAFATRDWEEHVADTKLGIWTTSDKAPAGWKPIASHSPMFMKRATFPIRGEDATETRHATVEYRFYTAPFIEEAMRPITDPNFLSRIKGWRSIRAWQAATKAGNLAWSIFHPKAEIIMAYNSMGPRDFIRGLRVDRKSSEFLAGQRELALAGGKNLGDVGDRTYEAYKSLKPSSIPTQFDIWRAKKGIRDLDKITEGFTHFTFDTIAGRFKVVDFMLKKAAFLAKNPGATPEELNAHLRGVAQYLNNVYGGINWENRGWSRATVEISRGVIMAPDWTYSNIFGLYDAAADWKTSSGRLSRAFWVKALTNGIAATIAASVMYQGKKFFQVVDEDKRNIRRALTEVYVGDDEQGNHIWRPLFFAGAQSDLVNTINKMADDGPLVGLSEEMRNKATPGLRTVPSLMLNKTYTGQEISDREEPWLTQARRQAGFAIGDMTPVPFWILTAKDMLFGPDSYKYSAGEVAETMLLASPAHHVRPPTGKPTKPGHFIESPEQLESTHKRQDYVRRIKSGDASVDAELDAQVDAGTITARQRANLYRLAQK